MLTSFNSDVVVNSALIWINFLVLVEIALIASITKHALHIKNWAVAILIPVATMFVKVQSDKSSWQSLDKEWKSWGSLAQHMNLIPGRTVLPIVLLFLISTLATDLQGRKKQTFAFTVGLFIVLTTLNNIEFGAPASIAVLIVLGFLTRLSVIKPKDLITVLLGAITALVFAAVLYQLNDSQLTLNSWLTMIRAHGVNGFMNLEMPFFGLWIFFYALLGASAIIGCNFLFHSHKCTFNCGELDSHRANCSEDGSHVWPRYGFILYAFAINPSNTTHYTL